MRVSCESKTLILPVLVFLASNAAANPECTGQLHFGNDGHTATWTVCKTGLSEDIAVPNAGRFEVAVFVGADGKRERFHWFESGESPGGTHMYRALNQSGTIELTRSVSAVSSNEFVQTISFKNLSPVVLEDISLQLSFGRFADRDVDEPAGLAKHLYGYQRFLQYKEGSGWQLASENSTGHRFAQYVRHRVLVLDTTEPTTLIRITGADGDSDWSLKKHIGTIAPHGSMSLEFTASALSTSIPILSNTNYHGLMYSHLWKPLAAVSRAIERLIAKLTVLSGNAALATIVLAILIRIVMTPITYWSFRQQKRFAAINKIMKPAISEIRKLYKGAEQSERILAVYKQHEISPFSGLKGSIGLFVQIPFLLAVFHVTTESSIFEHARFLWIENLALSDSLVMLPFTVPILGNAINVLPLGLGVLNLVSGKRESSESGTSPVVPVLISLIIVVLFYTVSAALVLYWFVANVLQILERVVFNQRLGRIRSDERLDRKAS